MALDDLLDDLHTQARKRFVKNEQRYGRLATLTQTLAAYENRLLTTQQVDSLDALAIHLKTQPSTTPGLEEAIRRIDRVRRHYHQNTPYIAHAIITHKRLRYTQRFAELRAYIARGDYAYDDLALTLHHLEHSQYVRRKARKDSAFAHEREEITALLNTHMKRYKQEQHREIAGERARRKTSNPIRRYFSGAKRVAARLAVGASTAALALAAVPSAAYQLLA